MTADLGARECALCGDVVVPVRDGWAHWSLRYVGFDPVAGPRWAQHDHPAAVVDDEAPACGNVLPSGLPGPDRPPFAVCTLTAGHAGPHGSGALSWLPLVELDGVSRVCPARPDLVVCHVCGPAEHCREATP